MWDGGRCTDGLGVQVARQALPAHQQPGLASSPVDPVPPVALELAHVAPLVGGGHEPELTPAQLTGVHVNI